MAGHHLRDLWWMTSWLGSASAAYRLSAASRYLWLPDHLWLPDCLWLQLNLLILSSSRAAAANTHWWTSHTMARALSQDPSFHSLKWLYMVQALLWNLAHGSGLEVLVGVCLSLSSGWVHSHPHWRHSLMESRISWQTFSISTSQGFLPGNLHS